MRETIKQEESKESLRVKAVEISGNKMPKLHEQIDFMSTQEIKHMFEELEIHKVELEMQNEALKETQDKLNNSKQKYFDLYNLAPVGYFTLNHKGVVLKSNLTAANMLGVTRGIIIDKNLTNFIAKESQDIYYLYRKKILESAKTESCDVQILKNNSASFWAHMSGSLSEGEDNEPLINITISDISELKKTQEKLLQQEQLMLSQSRQAAMGEMISMIAHQWRQPLMVVSLAASNIKIGIAMGKTITNEQLDEMSDYISDQTKYLSKTIDDFRNFFHPNKQRTTTTIYKIIDDTMNIIGKSLENDNIEVVINGTCTREIDTFSNELLQVLLSLINNAKDAINELHKNGAKIYITITERDTEVTLCVCDEGGGIPQDILSRLGEPYTTSKVVSGTGLGIYMSKMIVEKHIKGTLTWENRDNGACFTITIPLK
ncbi:PAS domain-containing sensor histidine kinase [Candidatus Sulfurimonas marisnigri]|uniref:histidine kinase n=1 Tax=Candidatus Sulfurimonas marisnigri TaxID=2740405 RepID=A0A7S7RP03_9BACT|nr:PAS domain-containing sensor histidine kinase [Candidatus Sulfurimonas marisnigri]QOY53847.1 PAS domain-containing sensor histidine kinase [Candidatus Sulfurimonas marisnigri]